MSKAVQLKGGGLKEKLLGSVLALLIVAGCGRSAEAPTATGTSPSPPAPTVAADVTVEPTATPTAPPSCTPRPTSTLRPTSTATPTRTPRQALLAQYPELAGILNNPEVDTAYKDLLVAYREGGREAAMDVARQRGLVTPEGNIGTSLMLDTEDPGSTVAQLQALGAQVVGASGNRVDVAFAPEALMSASSNPGQLLSQFSGLEHVTGVVPPQ